MIRNDRTILSRLALIACLAATALAPAAADARSFTVGQAVAVQTFDPHGTTETNTLGVIMNVYEALVRRNREMRIEPGLATAWQLVEPTRWRFTLRQGVVFQDGTPLTIADVVFSLQRAQAETSDARPAVRSIERIEQIDDNTFDIVTRAPNPVLLAEICNFYIMNKAWSEAHQATSPYTPTRRAGTENFATRHANGTGPYRLVSYEAGQQVKLERHARWWDHATNDLTEVTFAPIGSDATRLAALLSGDVDLINPIPEQAAAQVSANPAFRVVRGARPAVMFLGINQSGDHPFADLRVRQAMFAAIDGVALRRVVMRGSAQQAGSMIPEGVEGFAPEMDRHPAPDLAAARRLMQEAGYAQGFDVALNCTNDQYPQDEAVCTALAPMLARIGIRMTAQPESRSRFFPRITGGDTRFYLMAWYAPTFDAHHILWNTLQTKGGGNGSWNATGWSNAEFDALVGRIGVEMDPATRRGLIAEANRIERENMVYLPLYQLTLAWGARAGVDVVLRPDNRLDLRFVSVR
ncbi:ABC transporter substrate-binding protein [Neoroseomonas lacus]|uniref:ABC transporter substrate-binding protein n=1 Tax=Neoroseomonas lacus TaxID=287609 RepID=A0A917NTG1_9PROT|nr:ABC transporter substrate-binding protein [Neoroseomonas lacus]GGJ23614.1 ABC transporter substrate-binding protein [Neoroseomonas lacus]